MQYYWLSPDRWGKTRQPPQWAAELMDGALTELEGMTRDDEPKMLLLRDRLVDAFLERVSESSIKNYFSQLHRAIRIHFSPESGRLNEGNTYHKASDHSPDHIACVLVDVPDAIKRQNRKDQDEALERILNSPDSDRILHDPDAIVNHARTILKDAIDAYHDPERKCFYLDFAATLCLVAGLRPVEVLRDAVLEPGDSAYTVRLVAGQAKTRGSDRSYEMPTLVEADLVLEGFRILRELHDLSDYNTDNLIQSEQNKLRDRVFDLFNGIVPIATPQHLRAVYDAIAFFWFCPDGVREPAYIRAINGHSPEAGRVGAAMHYLKYEIGRDAIQRYGGAKGTRLHEPGIAVVEPFRSGTEGDRLLPTHNHQGAAPPPGNDALSPETATAEDFEISPTGDNDQDITHTPAIAPTQTQSQDEESTMLTSQPAETQSEPFPATNRNAVVSRAGHLLSAGTWAEMAIGLSLLTGLDVEALVNSDIEPSGIHALRVDGVVTRTLIQQLMPTIEKFRQLPPGDAAELQAICDRAFSDLIPLQVDDLPFIYAEILKYRQSPDAAAPVATVPPVDETTPVAVDSPELPPGHHQHPTKRTLKSAKLFVDTIKTAHRISPYRDETPTHAMIFDALVTDYHRLLQQQGNDAMARAVETIHAMNTKIAHLEETIAQLQAQRDRFHANNTTAQQTKALQQENNRLSAEVAALRSMLDDPQKLLELLAQRVTPTAPTGEPAAQMPVAPRHSAQPQQRQSIAPKSPRNPKPTLNDAQLDPDVIRAFDAVMAYNNAHGRTQDQMWVLSFPVMKELLTTVNKGTQTKIDAVMRAKAEELEQHYQQHGLRPRHNAVHINRGEKITDFVEL